LESVKQHIDDINHDMVNMFCCLLP